MEKTLRVLGGDDEGGHAHSHSHTHEHPVSSPVVHASNGASTALSNSEKNGLRSRHEQSTSANKEDTVNAEKEKKGHSGPSVLSAYLNLFGDFVHNM